MSEKNKIEVRIQGRVYTIVAEEPEEYIYKICAYLDKKIGDVAEYNPRLSADMAAVLTALNLADLHFKAQKTEVDLRRQIVAYDTKLEEAEQQKKRLQAQIEVLKAELERKNRELASRR